MTDTPQAEERKLATVLFADVSGSVSLGDRLDAERFKDIMSSYFDVMREAVEAFGGTAAKFMGDAIMATFGVPAAHEDDPARALRAALRMRDRLEELNRRLSETYQVALETHVGVNTGEVLAVTGPGPRDVDVAGDAVNVAARLQQAAAAGQIYVTSRTVQGARGFRFREVGAIELKGKAEPVWVYELVEEESDRLRHPVIQAPLVGRDSDLALLSSLYERVESERRPQLVTIYGEPGIGKTRLTEELRGWAVGRQPAPLLAEGRCLPYGEGTTYWPLGEILKGIAGVLDTDSQQVALRKTRELGLRVLGPATPDPARATAAIAFTVGLEDPDVRIRDLPPRQVRGEAHAGWRDFFSALCREAPLVAVVEDLHLGEATLLALLEDLAETVEGALMLVCTARPELAERRPSWGGGRRNFSSIALEPLRPEEAERLMGALLWLEDVPGPARGLILDRAEGNPFFLEEIVRQLIDEGHLVPQEGVWQVKGGLADLAIPDTVQAVLAARIDLLAPSAKRALQSASVVGRVFWTGIVRSLLDGDAGDLEQALRGLEERAFITERPDSIVEGEQEFTFKHVLVRDVAFESLPRRDRARAHALAASWIEERRRERSGEFVELLAHHYGEAYRGASESGADPDFVEALRSKAYEFLVRASDDARSRLVVDVAQRFAEQALALSVDHGERAGALEALGLAHFDGDLGSAAWRYLTEAVEERLAGSVADSPAIARLCARAVDVPMRWSGTMESLPEIEEVANYLETGLTHAGTDDSEELVRLLTAKSFWPSFAPHLPEERFEGAREAGEEAAAMALRMGRLDLASAALDGAGSVALSIGDYRTQSELTARRLELIREIEDPWELGDLLATAASDQVHIGRYRDAFRYADEATRTEVPTVELHALIWRVSARFRLGDWVGLHDDFRRIEAILGGRSQDPPGFCLRAFAAGALVNEIQGNRTEADRLMAMLERFPRLAHRVHTFVPWLAAALVRQERYAEARRELDDPAFETGRAEYGLALEVRCDLVAEEGSWSEAEQVVKDARAHAEEGGLLALPAFADRLQGRALLIEGAFEGAAGLLRGARERFAELEARWETAITDLFLAEAELGAGDPSSAGLRLTDALEVFRDLEAGREQALAERLGETLPAR